MLMLKQFAKKEKLKDHLLHILKQSKVDRRVDEGVIEPASEIITKIINGYTEIFEEYGEDATSDYIFNVLSTYVMLSLQLISANKQLMEKHED